MWTAWQTWARTLRRNITALYLAAHDARTPWPAKLLAAFVVAYALSPIDLVPDFIPVLGYLDDLILVPLGVWAAIRLVPAPLWAEFQARADAEARKPPRSHAAAVIIIALWIAAAVVLAWLFWPRRAG